MLRGSSRDDPHAKADGDLTAEVLRQEEPEWVDEIDRVARDDAEAVVEDEPVTEGDPETDMVAESDPIGEKEAVADRAPDVVADPDRLPAEAVGEAVGEAVNVTEPVAVGVSAGDAHTASAIELHTEP